MTGGSREGVGGIPPLVYHVSYDAREKESDQSSAMYVKRAAMTHERKEATNRVRCTSKVTQKRA